MPPHIPFDEAKVEQRHRFYTKDTTRARVRTRNPTACQGCRFRKVRCDLTDSNVPCTKCDFAHTTCVVNLRRQTRMKKAESLHPHYANMDGAAEWSAHDRCDNLKSYDLRMLINHAARFSKSHREWRKEHTPYQQIPRRQCYYQLGPSSNASGQNDFPSSSSTVITASQSASPVGLGLDCSSIDAIAADQLTLGNIQPVAAGCSWAANGLLPQATMTPEEQKMLKSLLTPSHDPETEVPLSTRSSPNFISQYDSIYSYRHGRTSFSDPRDYWRHEQVRASLTHAKVRGKYQPDVPECLSGEVVRDLLGSAVLLDAGEASDSVASSSGQPYHEYEPEVDTCESGSDPTFLEDPIISAYLIRATYASEEEEIEELALSD